MAGSLNWFQYLDDSGTAYSVFLDESNCEATVGGVALFAPRTTAHPLLSNRVKKRYLNATLISNPDIKRRFFVGNPDAIPQILSGGAFLAAVYPAAGDAAPAQVAWTVTSYRGEKSAIPPAVNTTSGDTGLVDGDPERD